ncbi:hypothetical protein [Nocardia paucivorans]|uniref:hypothetical protein n=1 Tax=Nocardia paucivorans TaxID=114259 RepID=UPI0002D83D24|nr:hypothetical protein [Nocardia paucivorans]
MTDVDAAEQLRRLRGAALAVLDRAGEISEHSESLRAALTELHRLATGAAASDAGVLAAQADPGRHLVSLYRYEGTEKRPIGLDEEAAEIRRELAGDRKPDPFPADTDPNLVVLTELRAMIIGSLLRELAARLAPGVAFGPGTDGQALAAVVTDLAQELLDQTFVGR